MPGNLNVNWIHGARNCATSTDPAIQVHKFDPDTFILRQSKCSDPGPRDGPVGPSFEAPFLYLLFGASRALLLDSGASSSPDDFPIAAKIASLRGSHAAAQGQAQVPLIVAHSHSHGDHIAGDDQLRALPGVTIAPLGALGVSMFFGLPNWPEGQGMFDLGDRILDVVPIPGHETSDIAIYDRRTGILLTGDMLYPGLLVMHDWQAYQRSTARLQAFADVNPISYILGSHIEMTAQPGRWFGLRTLFQPGEHVLQLEPRHLLEWYSAVAAMGNRPRTERHDDFILYLADDPMPPLEA